MKRFADLAGTARAAAHLLPLALLTAAIGAVLVYLYLDATMALYAAALLILLGVAGTLKNFKSFEIRYKLHVAFLFLTLIPLILLSLWNKLQMNDALTNAANVSLFAGATRTANRLDDFFIVELNNLRVKAALPALQDYLSQPSPASRQAVLRRLAARRQGPHRRRHAAVPGGARHVGARPVPRAASERSGIHLVDRR